MLWFDRLKAMVASVPHHVLRLRARRLGGNGQRLALIGLEALGHGRLGEVVAQGVCAYQPQVAIEGDQAAVEGLVVECVEGDAVSSFQQGLDPP